jgi:ankyrin repeat protein
VPVILLSGLVWWLTAPARLVRQEKLNNKLIRAAGLQDELSVMKLLDQGADPNATGDPESPYEAEQQDLADASPGLLGTLRDLLRSHKPRLEEHPYSGPRFPVLFIALGLGIAGKEDCYHYHINAVTNRVEGTKAQASIVKALLDRGAKTTIRGRERETPLTVAIMANNQSCIKMLLSLGADVNSVENYGDTPLHVAVAMLDSGTIRELLRRGARVNAQDESGATPLMYEASEHIEVMKALLSGHPDLSLKDSKGKTALMLAKEYNHPEIIDLLKEAGARE